MKGSNLGEFEELVLMTVAILADQAYGFAIQQEFEKRTGRSANLSAIHAALFRLEEKGFLSSKLGEPTLVRGGKRKKYVLLTAYGVKSLKQAQNLRSKLWKAMPKMILQTK